MNLRKNLIFGAVVSALTIANFSTHASMNDSKGIESLANKAKTVFHGQVADIQYKDSMDGIPHTFVTYNIVDDFGGQHSGKQLTLRFIGGVKKISDEHFEVLEVSNVPEFEVGSEDILFLKAEKDAQCPIVNCEQGLLRLKHGGIFTAGGQALLMPEQSARTNSEEAIGEIPGLKKQSTKRKGLSYAGLKKMVKPLLKGKDFAKLENANIAEDFSSAFINDVASPTSLSSQNSPSTGVIDEQEIQ